MPCRIAAVPLVAVTSVSISPTISSPVASGVTVGLSRFKARNMATPMVWNNSMLFLFGSVNIWDGLLALNKSINSFEVSRLFPFNSDRSVSRAVPSERNIPARDPPNWEERRVAEVTASTVGVWAETSAIIPTVRNPKAKRMEKWCLIRLALSFFLATVNFYLPDV